MIVLDNMQLNLRILKAVKKLENTTGFIERDDEKELYDALKEKGLIYTWNDEIYNPEVIIFKATAHNLEEVAELKKKKGWQADVYGVRR